MRELLPDWPALSVLYIAKRISVTKIKACRIMHKCISTVSGAPMLEDDEADDAEKAGQQGEEDDTRAPVATCARLLVHVYRHALRVLSRRAPRQRRRRAAVLVICNSVFFSQPQ